MGNITKKGSGYYLNALKSKFKDVIMAVLPVTIIVLLLNFTIAPIGKELIWRFIIGAIFIIFGLAIFLFGADLAIQPIGQQVGSAITRKRNLTLLIISGIFLGFLINVAEPDRSSRLPEEFYHNGHWLL